MIPFIDRMKPLLILILKKFELTLAPFSNWPSLKNHGNRIESPMSNCSMAKKKIIIISSVGGRVPFPPSAYTRREALLQQPIEAKSHFYSPPPHAPKPKSFFFSSSFSSVDAHPIITPPPSSSSSSHYTGRLLYIQLPST